ncbi:hypothetical protein RCZAHN_131 [Rhodobacter phage RcZahn]|nr:hypothetical protein RCZAHN_131 [Rhodobacter phage RcZahn]
MKEPTDHEIVFALTRATSKEMFSRGYAQGQADAGKPRFMRPLLAGVVIGAAITSLAWWGALTWMP